MANIIDLSLFRKDIITIKSLTDEEYQIPGNFSTEFYLYLYDSFSRIQENTADYKQQLNMMKEVALKIIQLDKNKNATIDTINEQFDDFNVLKALITETMKFANEITNDPNSACPSST